MNLFEVFGEVALKGQEVVAQGLADLDKKAEGFSDRLDNVGKGMVNAGTSMTKFVTGPIIGAGAALLGLTTNLGNTADRIIDLTDVTGMSATEIQKWQHVAKQAGTSTEAITKMMQRLNMQVSKIAEESGPAYEALTELGISSQEFVNSHPDQRVEMIVAALQKIPDPAERARLGTDLLGRQWEQLAPVVGMGAEALDKAREAGEKYAMSDEELKKANEFRIAMQGLKDEFGLVVRELTIAFLPIMQQLVAFISGSVIPVVSSVGTFISGIAEAFSMLPGPIQGAIGSFTALVAVIGPILVIGGKLLSLFAGVSKAVLGLVAAKGVLAAAMTAVGAAAAPLLAVLAPIIAIIAGIVAVVAAVVFAFKNWDAIMEVASKAWSMWVEGVKGHIETFRNALSSVADFMGRAWDRMGEMLSSLWSKIRAFVTNVTGIFSKMREAILNSISNLVRAAIERVTRMVRAIVDRIRSMYRAVVGNSIIPDMVSEVGQEMEHMTKHGTTEAGKFSDGVSSSLENTKLPSAPSSSSDLSSVGGGGQPVNVDMRHSVIKDDKDMLDRMIRSGAYVAGVF